MPTAKQILIIEDDPQISQLISAVLQARNYAVKIAPDPYLGLLAATTGDFDLALVDTSLSGMDGVELCREIKQQAPLPVIVLSDRLEIQDLVDAFDAGADDYLAKPFEPEELVARIAVRADGRRTQTVKVHNLLDLEIFPELRTVKKAGVSLELTPLEFKLLLHLASKPWKAFTREELLAEVWGYRQSADTRLVNVHVQRLRAKIETDPAKPRYIQTVRGAGYRAGS